MVKIGEIKGYGDTKKDCVDYLAKHPELRGRGYKVVKLGNVWVVGRNLPNTSKARKIGKRK